MSMLLYLCENNFCDDFNGIDETLSEKRSMYLIYIYNSFILNLFLTF